MCGVVVSRCLLVKYTEDIISWQQKMQSWDTIIYIYLWYTRLFSPRIYHILQSSSSIIISNKFTKCITAYHKIDYIKLAVFIVAVNDIRHSRRSHSDHAQTLAFYTMWKFSIVGGNIQPSRHNEFLIFRKLTPKYPLATSELIPACCVCIWLTSRGYGSY